MIDTRNKRASVIGFALPFLLVGPNPDGSLAISGDRQQIAHAYRLADVAASSALGGGGLRIGIGLGLTMVRQQGVAAVAGVAATVSRSSRDMASASGGAPLTLTGTGFVSGCAVAFGGTAGTSVIVLNSTTLTVVAPAHAAGVVDITVTNPGATAGTLVGGLEYLPAPTTTFFATDFESGTLTPFNPDGTAGTVTASAELPYRGAYSCKSARTTTGVSGVFLTAAGGVNNPAQSDANGIYIRQYVCITTNTVQHIAQIKVHLYRPVGGAASDKGWLMAGTGPNFYGATPYNLICYRDENIVTIPGGRTALTFGDGVWFEILTHYKRAPGVGTARMWVNGKLLVTDVHADLGSDDPAARYSIQAGMVYVDTPTVTPAVYLDDIVGANGYTEPVLPISS